MSLVPCANASEWAAEERTIELGDYLSLARLGRAQRSDVASIERILQSATKDLPPLASREDRGTICPAPARTF
jgi:hypothetical protein